MTRPRIAVVGLGGIAQSVHLPVVQRNRSAIELVALVELSPSRLATFGDRYGVPADARFTGVDDLVAAVADGLVIDAAILATSGEHAEDAGRLIAAGVRVLAEKPLAYSSAALDALDAVLTDAGRAPEQWLRVGYMKEHDPAVRAMREALGRVTPRALRIEVLHPADHRQLAFAHLEQPATDLDPDALRASTTRLAASVDAAIGTVPDRERLLYQNVMLGSIIHDIALTRHLGLGLASVDHAQHTGPDFPGSVTAQGSTDGGVPWTLGWHFLPDFPAYLETLTVLHDAGSIELEFQTPYVLNAPTVLRVREGGGGLASASRETAWPQQEAFEEQLHRLLELVANQSPDGSSLAAARQDLITAQALWRACTPNPERNGNG